MSIEMFISYVIAVLVLGAAVFLPFFVAHERVKQIRAINSRKLNKRQ